MQNGVHIPNSEICLNIISFWEGFFVVYAIREYCFNKTHASIDLERYRYDQ